MGRVVRGDDAAGDGSPGGACDDVDDDGAAELLELLDPIGGGARPVWLYDLAFHEVCAPRCRACGVRLTARDEHRWSYNGRVVSNQAGYTLHPTDFWCDECRDVHDRDLVFDQD